MMAQNTVPLVFVLDDGICNSVFSGQIMHPLLKKLETIHKIYIISFEKNKLTKEIIDKYIPRNEKIIFITLKRLPFMGKATLYFLAFKLKKILKNIPEYSLIARGPIAGWVAFNSIDENSCVSFKVQARGLLAQEYEFVNCDDESFIKKYLHNWRKNQLEIIEYEAYSPSKILPNFSIEAVSIALKDYLIRTYKADKNKISLANEDIPELIPAEQKDKWRLQVRTELNISDDTHVYCYSGSIKAWQHPELVVFFFKKNLEKNQKVFLLILTQDIQEFYKFLAKDYIDPIYYKIINVHYDDIYKYLSACDTGLIFRKEHIVSWVSRPVKAMEYQSVNLKIIHNNTVKWLIEQDAK